MRISVFAAALAGAMSLASSAAAVTFDFTGLTTQTQVTPKSYTSGILSVTATIASGDPGPLLQEADSPSFIRGLGVVDSLDIFGSIDVDQSISFSIPVGFAVTSVTLSRRGSTDQSADISVTDGNTLIFSTTEVLENQNDINGLGSEVVPVGAGGSILSIASSGGNTGGVWVNAIEFSEITIDTGVVPLPAGFVLLGGALVAGAAATRRKRAA